MLVRLDQCWTSWNIPGNLENCISQNFTPPAAQRVRPGSGVLECFRVGFPGRTATSAGSAGENRSVCGWECPGFSPSGVFRFELPHSKASDLGIESGLFCFRLVRFCSSRTPSSSSPFASGTSWSVGHFLNVVSMRIYESFNEFLAAVYAEQSFIPTYRTASRRDGVPQRCGGFSLHPGRGGGCTRWPVMSANTEMSYPTDRDLYLQFIWSWEQEPF